MFRNPGYNLLVSGHQRIGYALMHLTTAGSRSTCPTMPSPATQVSRGHGLDEWRAGLRHTEQLRFGAHKRQWRADVDPDHHHVHLSAVFLPARSISRHLACRHGVDNRWPDRLRDRRNELHDCGELRAGKWPDDHPRRHGNNQSGGNSLAAAHQITTQSNDHCLSPLASSSIGPPAPHEMKIFYMPGDGSQIL